MATNAGDISNFAIFTPVDGLAKIIIIILLIQAATELIGIYNPTADIVSLVLAFANLFLFLIWFYRVDRNLPALGASELQFTPRWAVIWWFIPILNLWKPYQVAVEIMKASDPSVRKTTASSRKGMKRPILILAWWLYSFVGIAIALAATIWLGLVTPWSNDTAGANGGASSVIIAISSVAAIALQILVVKEISKRQKRKWEIMNSGGQEDR